MSKAIAKQILDEKQGLATGQPEIEVADSLSTFLSSTFDEPGERRLGDAEQARTGKTAPSAMQR